MPTEVDGPGPRATLRALSERDRLERERRGTACVRVVHRTRGRVRLRLDRARGADVARLAARLAAYLAAKPGVIAATPAAVSGSVLVLFDGARTSGAAIVAAVRTSSPSDWPDVAPRPEGAWGRVAFDALVLLAAVTNASSPALTTAAVAVTAVPSVRRAVHALSRGELTVDALDVAAVIAALASSRPATASFMTWLLAVGDLVLERTADRARRSIGSLVPLDAGHAWRARPDGRVERVRASMLARGDRIVVYAGERAPAGGIVVDGVAMVDEKALTGESLPRVRRPGDRVLAASVVVDGRVAVAVDRTGADTAAARIVGILQGAGAKPMTLQRNAERVANRLVVPTLAVAILAALLTGQADRMTSVLITDFGSGIRVAVPTAALTGMMLAAREGVLVKGAQYLERLGRADTIVFDKTGTLTRGEPAIVDARAAGARPLEETLAYAAAAEAHQHHPVAAAVRRWAEARGVGAPPGAIEDERSSIGKGVCATVGGVRVVVGRRRLLRDEGVDVAAAESVRPHHRAIGASSLLVAVDGRLEAVLGYADEPRPESAEVVARLRRRRRREVVLMSGDVRRVADALGRRLGLNRVMAELLPEDKAKEVRAMQSRGRVVAMVGDGINDAPALALADVGISLHGGTELARETADVVLLRGGLRSLPRAFELADAAMRRVNDTLAIVVAPNAVAIVLGALGLVSPAVAAAVNNGSTVIAALVAVSPLLSATRAAT